MQKPYVRGSASRQPPAPLLRQFAYLPAGAEFGFAVLSFGCSRLADAGALRLIARSCIVFHGLSGVLEAYAYIQGAGPAILANVVARVGIVCLFFIFSRSPG